MCWYSVLQVIAGMVETCAFSCINVFPQARVYSGLIYLLKKVETVESGIPDVSGDIIGITQSDDDISDI